MSHGQGPDQQAADELTRGFARAVAEDPSTRVEDFCSQSDTSPDVLRGLIDLEIQQRLAAGETLDRAEYEQRFPTLAAESDELLSQRTVSRARPESDDATLIPGAEEPGPAPIVVPALGDYEILEMIGRGGMGVVYRARQRRLNRIVAVKMIATGQLAQEEEIHRFRQEAEAAARLDHPGIVPVYEIDEQDGVLFFSMGYVPGSSLAHDLEEKTLAYRAAAELLRELANAVQYAHECGVVHRDLKPANVLMDTNGKPRITDFGLAKLADSDGVTITGAVLGTPSYMAPEQAAGAQDQIGEACDVYALGAILYACLCGHAPFRGVSAMATMRMVIHQRPIPLSQLREDIPRDLETICEKCLEKAPESRYASAQAVADELERFLDGRPILARPVSAWTRLRQWRRRNPLVAGLLLVIAVSLIAGTAVSVHFAVLAGRRAARAERGFQAATEQSELALKTVRTVIHTVQERLKEIPAARAVRRDLLLQVLDDLKAVSNGYLEQSTVDRESAQVFAELGDLFSEIGDDGGTGVLELSDRHYRRAIEIYRQLLTESPEDDELTKALLYTSLAYGDISREYRRFAQAEWARRQACGIATTWRDRMPGDAEAELAYLEAEEALGEVLIRSGQVEESRKHCEEALQLALAYRDRHGTIGSLDVLARCYCTLGDMHRSAREFDEAQAAFEQMCAVTLKLMELEPENPQRVLDRSTDFERLGDLHMDRGELDKARDCFEEMLRLTEEYVSGDPENLYRLQESTWAYVKIAKICAAQGETERAEWASRKLAQLRARLDGTSP